LAKRENTGVYDDYGPENPYWTDEEDDAEDVKVEIPVNDVLEKAKKNINQVKGNKIESFQGRDSPKPEGFKVKVSMANEEQPAKKQKIDETGLVTKHTPPPPPSAAQVVAKAIEKERKRKRVGSRGLSPSPVPPSPKTPPSLPSTPLMLDESDPSNSFLSSINERR
jgi:hypothetical protein